MGVIDDKYAALGGPTGPLGPPTGEGLAWPESLPGSGWRRYENGIIIYTPQLGAHEIHGEIFKHWTHFVSLLGNPVTDELLCPDRFGHFNHFERGAIYWTPDTGAWEVHGAILGRWRVTGWERGPLGYPTTDERPLDGGGAFNHFQRGSIYWTGSTGAHSVYGSIRDKWASRGWETDPDTGYPIAEVEQSRRWHPQQVFSDFENGVLYASPGRGVESLPAMTVLFTEQLEERIGTLVDGIAAEHDLHRDGKVEFRRRTDYSVDGDRTINRGAIYRAKLFKQEATGDIDIRLDFELVFELDRVRNAIRHWIRDFQVEVSVPMLTEWGSYAEALWDIFTRQPVQAERVAQPDLVADQIRRALDPMLEQVQIDQTLDFVALSIKLTEDGRLQLYWEPDLPKPDSGQLVGLREALEEAYNFRGAAVVVRDG